MSEKTQGKYSEEIKTLYKVAERVAAGESMASILELTPGDMAFFEGRAYEFHRRGQFERAEEVALGIVALDETRVYPLLVLGDVALRRRDAEEAVMWLERAAEQDPEDVDVLIRLGEAHVRAGSFERANAMLDRVIAAGGKGDEVYARRARALKGVAQGRQREEATATSALPAG
ncbi:tetratricopeptide repeat protein [Lujinxingia vulgaris]|uniref:Tetratricopeptide repeat protein n=1 Tax=Lujinxingia vulgaris TaxID=2600176 RepID=A0A5C6XL94_9DELT|nr:tetratricopeptide repeat protein [Lujinxingia vulgaris]TXD38367.1 tetratricopeptide repeat protein [Lujinxingia vulgaris]